MGSLILFGALSPISNTAWGVFNVLTTLYVLSNFIASIITCFKPKLIKYLPIIPFVFWAYHFGYGYGFLRGVIDFFLLKKRISNIFTKITR